MHVMRGPRRALLLVVALAAVALLAAVVWSAISGGGFRVKVAIALLAVGGLGAITGNGITRSGTAEIFALQGRAPDGQEPRGHRRPHPRRRPTLRLPAPGARRRAPVRHRLSATR